MLPTVHNLDSFPYNASLVNGHLEPSASWSALFDDRWAGRVALVDKPVIGIFDAALAAQARGEVHFNDIGNMSATEIDRLIGFLVERERAGYFCGFRKTALEAVDKIRVAMFLWRIERKKDGKTYAYWNIVENKRLDDGRAA
jgi:putative spermidine/putrescine transport system substrate-binding protein